MPLWTSGLAASAAVLAALAWVVGRDSPASTNDAGQAILLAGSSPGVSLAIAGGALVCGAWCVRHLNLLSLAWRPGSIHVAEFTKSDAKLDAPADQLTMDFRRRLATLQLQSPTPVPGAPPASDFLDVLDRTGASMSNPVAAVASLVRAAKPTHAYEVHGVLLERAEQPRCGVAIEVTRAPSEGLAATTVWGATWECVLRRAANEATAAILPQTRRCRAPWAGWRGYRMPGRLLHSYEEGARLEHERRYDEALDHYYEALKDDPMNMVLRLRIGQLQERLGLLLDAFATYSGIGASTDPAPVREPGLLYRSIARRERRRAQLSASYRRIVLLGGRVLAEQWRTVPSDPETERDLQRKRLRSCLRPKLLDELAPYVVAPKQLEDLLAEPTQDDRLATLRLRTVLAGQALALSQDLHPGRDRRSTLTPATVRLTELCIRIRLASVRKQLGEDVSWPPAEADIHDEIAGLESRLRGFRRWHEHYNAACAYALPLLDDAEHDHDADPARRALARAAVKRLEEANACADSAYIASRRDWLLSEDPDLRGLRARPEFAEFEVMQLPSSSITPRRPVAVQQLESSRYVRDLLLAASRQWQAIWRDRRAQLPAEPDVAILLEWVADELRAWDAVRTVARHYRHSGSRLTLIHSLQGGAGRYGHAVPPVAFPRYERDPLEGARERERCDDPARKELDVADGRLARLREIVDGRSQERTARFAHDLENWRARLRGHQAEAQPADARQVARICELHAALWQQLGEWIGADEDAPARERAFKQTVLKVRGHWRGWRALPGGGAKAA